MTLKRILGSITAMTALIVAVVLYTVHPVKSSDHQDTYNLANRSNTSADITDVFVFPSPTNPNNVVFAMDVSPLIPAGMGTAKFFDPTVIWQFKISHQSSGAEDQVIQFAVNGTDANQQITMFGPAKPNEVGTTNTLVTTGTTGTFNYNVPGGTTLSGGIIAFAGPRADPFNFDLFQFFSFLGDRLYSTHTSQTDPGQGDTLYNGNPMAPAGVKGAIPPYEANANPNQPTFNGFAAGTTSNALGNYACSTNAPVNALADVGGGFNVLTFVAEVPKNLIYGGTTAFSSPIIHVWATANSSTGS